LINSILGFERFKGNTLLLGLVSVEVHFAVLLSGFVIAFVTLEQVEEPKEDMKLSNRLKFVHLTTIRKKEQNKPMMKTSEPFIPNMIIRKFKGGEFEKSKKRSQWISNVLSDKNSPGLHECFTDINLFLSEPGSGESASR